MNIKDALNYEKSGNDDLALAHYTLEVAENRVSEAAVRGLFWATMRVGDVASLVLTLPDVSRVAGINDDSANLMQARLLIEIGEVEEAKKLVYEINDKHLSTPEISELDLLKADIFACEFRFHNALESLKQTSQMNTNTLRRVAELELALQKPTEVIAALQRYVAELNKNNEANGDTNRFITASGPIFNLANQIWLEQRFSTSDKSLSLSQSMKVLVDYCKLTSKEISFANNAKQNQNNKENSQNATIEQSLTHPRSYLDLSKNSYKQPSNLESLIEFTKERPSNREYSNAMTREWESTYFLANEHFFAIEESGLAITTNFGICSNCEFLSEWHQSLLTSNAAGRKSELPHLSASGSLTRYLAEMVQSRSIHSPTILHRSKLRAVRTLPARYSA
jgi:hypothetical protein